MPCREREVVSVRAARQLGRLSVPYDRGDGWDQAGHLKYVDNADEDGYMQSLSHGDITWRVLESVRGTASCRAASSLRTTSSATDPDL
jgi:hypothetical protein